MPSNRLPGLIASTVFINNLGLSYELWYQALGYVLTQQTATQLPRGAEPGDPNVAVQPGLDDARLGQYLTNGNVLFCHNHCELNLLEVPSGFAVTSVYITSLDDVGFQQNQCDCDLVDDFVYLQAFLYAISVRVTGNRFKETLGRAAFSAGTFGRLNTTTDNQSTHCLLIRGTRIVQHSNLVMQELFNRPCAPRVIKLQTQWDTQQTT